MSKKRQFIIIIIVLAAIAISASFISTHFIKDKMIASLIEEETHSQLLLTQQVAHLLETEINSIHDKVNLIAQFPQIRDGNTETCNEKLAEIQPDIKSQLDNITKFNTDFVLDCAINQTSLGYKLTADSPITQVIKDPAHAPYLSYSGYSPVSNQEVLYLNVPVYNSKREYVGIIGGVIYLNYIGDKYLTQLNPQIGSSVALIDDNANFLYHPEKEFIGKNLHSPEYQTRIGNDPTIVSLTEQVLKDAQANKSGTTRYSLFGDDLISAYASARVFPGRTWTFVLTVPVSSIIAKIEKNEQFGGLSLFLYLYSAIFLIFTLFSALLLLLITKGIFTPLRVVRDVTEKIGQGQLDVAIDPKLLSRKDEFGGLLTSVDKMARQLKQYNQTLEEKIQEKTKQLDEKVKTLEDTKEATLNLLEDFDEIKVKDEAILASIGDGLVVVHENGTILMINKAGCDLLGFSSEELIGKKFVDVVVMVDENNTIIPREKRPIQIAKSNSKPTTIGIRSVYQYVRRDKTRFPVAITVTTISDDKKSDVIEVFRDITHEIEIDKAKSEFVSLASHQLRTPLGIMKWYLEALENEDYLRKAPEAIRKYFDEIYKNNERVLNLVRDLLSVSRIDQRRVKNISKPVDLIKSVTEVVEQMQIVAHKKDIKLKLALEDKKIPPITLDVLRFYEVIENLVGNAIEYTPTGGSVDVVVKKHDKSLLIKVSDTGIGISKADQKMLFTKFFRSEKAVVYNPEGSGLGLYVVKSYVEGWGGKMNVESNDGKGSTFTISLPISQK